MSDTHNLRRTSPKGFPFIGTCTTCGLSGLSPAAALKPCSRVLVVKTRFQIDYLDPKTQEPATHIGEYEPWLDYTARQMAEDHAYTLADKAMGTVTIKELR